jgi:hypothetical protein
MSSRIDWGGSAIRNQAGAGRRVPHGVAGAGEGVYTSTPRRTLVVALYYAVFAAGVRAPQSVDAMAMIHMIVTLMWLLIALRFVNPTQLVSRVKEHPQHA